MSAVVHLDAAALAAALPFGTLIEGLAQAFADPPQLPVRQRLEGADGRELLVMPAISDQFAGVKMLTIVPGNVERGRPTIQGLYALFDFDGGELLATMDADELTARRTAAVSALACDRLARLDARSLLIVGSGHLVPYLAAGHAEVRNLDRITLWARDRSKGDEAVRRIRVRLPGISVELAEDLPTGVREADIVSSATRATTALIAGDWLRPGVHLDLVGGYRPEMREVDDAGIISARIFVDTRDSALAEAGDLIQPIARGVITEGAIEGDLTAIANRTMRPRDPTDRTLFKSVGTAVADLAAARIAWMSRG